MNKSNNIIDTLPGLDCGLCGSKSCADFARVVTEKPEAIKKCLHLSGNTVAKAVQTPHVPTASCQGCQSHTPAGKRDWKDSLGREYDFILDTFPNEPGPRETIIPHNPIVTRELEIKKGDILIGRPLGISCGCPITHCGFVMNVDYKTGVIVWCVTGPLGPRAGEHKDLGYYSAQAYEGLITETNKEIKVGMRYWFLPHRCMLQWRHSGLINFVNKTKTGLQIRIEGLWIG